MGHFPDLWYRLLLGSASGCKNFCLKQSSRKWGSSGHPHWQGQDRIKLGLLLLHPWNRNIAKIIWQLVNIKHVIVGVTMYFNIVLSIFKFYMISTCRHSFLDQHVDLRKKHQYYSTAWYPMRLPVQKYFHPRTYQLLRMWFVFYLNQIGIHDNQLIMLSQNWYSTGYIAMYINCTVLHCRTLYTFSYSHSFLIFLKLKLNVRRT